MQPFFLSSFTNEQDLTKLAPLMYPDLLHSINAHEPCISPHKDHAIRYYRRAGDPTCFHNPINMASLKDFWAYFWNFRYLPLQYRLRMIKIRRRLLPTETGWGLRAALRHARSLQHPPQPNPYLFVCRLLWPFPRWSFPASLPRPPRDIMADPDSVTCRWRDLMYLASMPLWRSRDTPQRSFYRLYEAFCASDGHMVASETEYFWGHAASQWATEMIPDPECENAEQYAVMASLAETLATSCNWRLEIGLRRNGDILGPGMPMPEKNEESPPWTSKVPPLSEQLVLDQSDDGEETSNAFLKRGIVSTTGYFYTV